MGQPMPDKPIVYGDNCSICFPTGKTPKYVYARFSLMNICTGPGFEACHVPPNDRVFKLTQVDGTPCSWYYLSGLWNIYYSAWKVADGKSRLKLEDNRSQGVFEQTRNACPEEGIVWYNTLSCFADTTCGWGGIACVTWTPQATKLLGSINMKRAQDLFMELRPLESGNLVYKFCRLQDATNIKILFEP